MAGKTRLDVDRIRALHAEGMHPDEMARELECHPSTVINQLHRLDLEWERKPRGRCKLTSQDKQAIVNRYLANEGATIIARDLAIDKKTVYNVLNDAGVGTRSRNDRKSGPCEVRQRRHKSKGLGSGNREEPLDKDLRHDAFLEWSGESTYWIGMLMSDGCIHQEAYGQPSICLRLQRGDKGHLERLKEWLGTSRAIVDSTHESWGKVHESSCLAWRSRKQATLLYELGVRNHKDGRWVSDRLSQYPSFWRGMVDGDGCVYSRGRGTIYLSAMSEQVISRWVDWCESLGAEVVDRVRDNGLHVGNVRTVDGAREVIQRLYKGAKVYLPRKAERAATWW